MTIRELLKEFESKTILIVGDVMIDSYVMGKVQRLSPEAPVPIVNLKKEEHRLGGAANVALNIKSLGAKPILCSVVGNDESGAIFYNLLEQEGMSTNGIVQSSERVTTVKKRVLGNNQQLLRIDSENTHDLSSTEWDKFITQLRTILESTKVDGIILEDYNKGVLSKEVIQRVITLAKEKNIPTTVDPKLNNFLEYKGVTLFKPNLKELREGLNRKIDFSDKQSFTEAVSDLEAKLNNEISFVTLSEDGVFIQSKTESHHIKAHLRNIADVSGAGDTVISFATLCLVAGCDIRAIAELSNLAGGLVCEKLGVVCITPEEIIDECENKIGITQI